MTSQLKKFDESVNLIIHDVNVSHSIDCNPRARYYIQKHCIIIHNRAIMKYNDLKEWITSNPEANSDEISKVVEMIDEGKDVRGFKFDRINVDANLLNRLERYMASCLDDNGYTIENEAESLVFDSVEELRKLRRKW